MRLNILIVCTVLVIASTSTTAIAQVCDADQKHKLLADDGAADDYFGRSVAIDGSTAIVGAHLNDDNGGDSGSAYLFDTKPGTQLAKLLPADGAASDLFGLSVAIDGSIAIVGAHWDDDNGEFSGSAYLFDTNTGAQLAKLLPEDGAAGNFFGYSVAIDGSIAIVGARFDDENGIASGSAYLFDTSTGSQLAKLLPMDGAALDEFGSSVAIHGSIAIVGAYLDDDKGADSGSAYLFDTTTGAQVAKLLPDDGAPENLFGSSVAIDGPIAVVGAPYDDDNGIRSGSGYLFDTNTGAQLAKLLPDDGAALDFFGGSVAIDASIVIVGASQDDRNGANSGSAYLFDTVTGTQLAKLLPDDGAASDLFGHSVAISGTTAIVGAYFDDDNGSKSGSAYLFDIDCASSKPGDLDGDGDVDFDDFSQLLANWGEPGCNGTLPCPADIDGDGDVDFDDFTTLLANWS